MDMETPLGTALGKTVRSEPGKSNRIHRQSSISRDRADFGKLTVAETEKWARVIKFAGIKPE
jgi:hypothetical protein